MKNFEEFLLQNPFQSTALSEMLVKEFESFDNKDFDENSRLIAASMLAASKMFDDRLKAYHNWLHQPDDGKTI